MSNFFKGLDEFNEKPQIDFTPEYRVYYEEGGNIIQRYATAKDTESPVGDFIVLPFDKWSAVNEKTHKVINEEIKKPKTITRAFTLERTDTGKYHTAENNLYFVGRDDRYAIRRTFD